MRPQFGKLAIGDIFQRVSENGVWEKTADVQPLAPLEVDESIDRPPNCKRIDSTEKAFLFYETLVQSVLQPVE